MFKDYYQILGISPFTSKQEIKKAYREMSLKWHPDRNPGVDVTEIMQDINEAYSILSDDESRSRYDNEYKRFTQQKEYHQTNLNTTKTKTTSWNYEYNVKDENLKENINTARAKAKDLVDEFFRNLKETSKVAAKGAWDGAYVYIVGGIIATIIFALIKACH